MPVVVTGGDEPLGRALLAALLTALPGGELRAVVSTRAGQRDLVLRGVRAARVGLDDADLLAAVLAGAHTVVHAAGPEPADTLGPVSAAVRTAQVPRLLVVTARPVPGAVAPGRGVVERVLAADARS